MITSQEEPKPPSPLASPSPWNLVAEGYDSYTREFLAGFSQLAISRIELEEGARVVDVACGPGTSSLLLASRAAHIDAVDFSADMLKQFRAHLDKERVTNVALHEADGQSLPLADATYDLGISMFGLMFFPDRVRGMRELFRVLKPNGRVLIGSWAPAARSPLMTEMFSIVRAVDPTVSAPEQDMSSHENPEIFKAELEEAGFSDVRVDELEHGMLIEDVDEFWRAMAEGAVPIVMMKNRLDPDDWREREERGLKLLRESLKTPCHLSSVAHLGYGVKA